MIKADRHRVKARGTNSELLANLAAIVESLMTEGEIREEMIDVAVGLGKASAKGKDDLKKYMYDKLEEALRQKSKEATEIGIDLEGLLKQIKEKREKEE